MQADAKSDRYVRKIELPKITGLSIATLYRMERKGQFPKRRRLSSNSVGWLMSELTAWLQSREICKLGVGHESN